MFPATFFAPKSLPPMPGRKPSFTFLPYSSSQLPSKGDTVHFGTSDTYRVKTGAKTEFLKEYGKIFETQEDNNARDSALIAKADEFLKANQATSNDLMSWIVASESRSILNSPGLIVHLLNNGLNATNHWEDEDTGQIYTLLGECSYGKPGAVMYTLIEGPSLKAEPFLVEGNRLFEPFLPIIETIQKKYRTQFPNLMLPILDKYQRNLDILEHSERNGTETRVKREDNFIESILKLAPELKEAFQTKENFLLSLPTLLDLHRQSARRAHPEIKAEEKKKILAKINKLNATIQSNVLDIWREDPSKGKKAWRNLAPWLPRKQTLATIPESLEE